MKKTLKWSSRGLALVLALILCLPAMAAPARAAESEVLETLCYRADAQAAETTAIGVQSVRGRSYLFLPSGADLRALTLWFEGDGLRFEANGKSVTAVSGEPFDLAALFPAEPEDGKYTVAVQRGEDRAELTVMCSAGVRALFLTSAKESEDRAWVEEDKENKAKNGGVVLLRADGTQVYSGTLKNIKGRGNSTWNYDKKPYQIKLSEKVDLLETGDKSERASTWVLLANYVDETHLRNVLAYGLAAEMGMPYSPHCEPVDLYYDGEYRGTYLLSEKTEIASGRVEVNNLEGDIEDANPDVEDMDDLETKLGVNSLGNMFQYVDGLNMPEDISGGYLLEMDFDNRARAEKSWFKSSGLNYLVSKSPEYLSADAMEYISNLWQEFEDAVYHGGVNPETGKDYRELVDLTSLARQYLLMELSQNGDAFQSSAFFYKPQGEEKFYAGPVWDYDSAFGRFGFLTTDYNAVEGLWAGSMTVFGRKLIQIPSFMEEVRRVYREELRPLVETALSGDTQARSGSLRSLVSYRDEWAASLRLDRALWPECTTKPYEEAVEELRSFLAGRDAWLYGELMDWDEQIDYFRDVPEEAWYADAVREMASLGLFSTTKSSFEPFKVVDRVSAAALFHGLAGREHYTVNAHMTDVPDWVVYADAVNWSLETGVIDGVPGTRFNRYHVLTRQEAVTMLYRFAKLNGLADGAEEIPDRFEDKNKVADWAEEAMGWAIATGMIDGVTDTTLVPRRQINRAEMACLLQRYLKYSTSV